ncbi:hypothetical protein ELH92_06685 [Rhizobium ruizarguesonis]|nr:hypothetical protein [Rhizobium leguminosarum bv. viciae]TAT99206.1 hypothetical protein ELI53_06575 [Rhizobium ruizarguesonis]NKL26404.1 hypothetical protein [Rhizobium leguminosarum bv. viciae]NKL42019.1 hypothetical protein [Rhizobium leguminosarum bv. viciae]TAU47755.1 hypothetical protein ELI42_06745 [Rhizobium ruizarguesonis]
MGRTETSFLSLIPVLVTGIQPSRVRAMNDSFFLAIAPPAPKDLGALDSCDKHRNEGGLGCECASQQQGTLS